MNPHKFIIGITEATVYTSLLPTLNTARVALLLQIVGRSPFFETLLRRGLLRNQMLGAADCSLTSGVASGYYLYISSSEWFNNI